MWCTIDYYFPIKKNEVIKSAGKWVILEMIILSKPTWPRKSNPDVLFHIWLLISNLLFYMFKLEKAGNYRCGSGGNLIKRGIVVKFRWSDRRDGILEAEKLAVFLSLLSTRENSPWSHLYSDFSLWKKVLLDIKMYDFSVFFPRAKICFNIYVFTFF